MSHQVDVVGPRAAPPVDDVAGCGCPAAGIGVDRPVDAQGRNPYVVGAPVRVDGCRNVPVSRGRPVGRGSRTRDGGHARLRLHDRFRLGDRRHGHGLGNARRVGELDGHRARASPRSGIGHGCQRLGGGRGDLLGCGRDRGEDRGRGAVCQGGGQHGRSGDGRDDHERQEKGRRRRRRALWACRPVKPWEDAAVPHHGRDECPVQWLPLL